MLSGEDEKMRHLGRCCLLAGLVLLASVPAYGQEGLVITEILSLNRSGLQDEDGEYSDWIELYNNSDTAINLSGYKLTDDLEDLTKWEFPEVTLGPRRYLLVFASDKDRRLPNSPLHTNFKLERQGELLALITPDGSNVVAAFAPQYPRQVSDVSWGLATDSEFTQVVDSETAVRVHVPADAATGLDWVAPGFDDSSWREGTFGVGLERSPNSARSFAPMIGTDVEEAMYRVNGSIYIRSTFNVADSSAIDSMVLGMQYDDGFVLFLNGERIVDANGPPPAELAWDSEADTSNPDTRALEFEEFDLSEHTALLRDGVNVLAIQGLNVSTTSNDFLVNPTLELIDLGPVNAEVRQYFVEPTPGGPNRQGVDSVSPDPAFSHDSGAYGGNLMVELAAEGEGAVIRYTLDGTIPDAGSEVYAGPVAVTAAATLTARVWVEGSLPGESVSRSYLMLSDSVQAFTSNLPIVLIDTFGRGIGEGSYTQVFCQFIDVGEDGRASITGEPDYVGRAGMKVRGSSSTGFPKKQYAFETWDEANEDLDVSVLGMPAESDWILHAPYSDKSLMRNVLCYQWSNHIGQYAVRTKFVEVYMNTRRNTRIGSSPAEYMGVYVFMEKIKRDGDRVDIERLLPGDESAPEVTGGYILKKDRLDPGDTGLTTSRGQRLAYFYPKERLIRPAQRTYIRNYLNAFEAALYGANFTDPEAGYAAHIDVMSFIDHHIMVEIAKNIDGYRLSTFMYKPRGGKLRMGPIWDYNLSLGNANYLNGGNPVGWYYPQLGAGDYPWYARLFQDTRGFRAMYSERWRQLRGELFSLDYLLGTVDQWAGKLRESQERNFQRWNILGSYVWPNFYIAPTWEDEISWMSNWLENRVAWMDGQLIGLPTRPEFSSNGGFIDPGFELSITSGDEGQIYYTLDGSDPKGPRAVLGEAALLYEAPLVLSENTQVTARVRSGPEFWSLPRSAVFVTGIPTLRITELMYHPPDPTLAEDPEDNFSATNMEFIEFQNIGTEPLDLAGMRFSRGVRFEFEEGQVLGAGEYGVLVGDLEAFTARYGTEGITVLGDFSGSFSDRTETIEFLGELEVPIHNFSYSDTWHPQTDGEGYSLVIRDTSLPLEGWGEEASWRASSRRLGTPGAADDGEVEPGGGLQMPGDVNQDGQLNLSDAVSVLTYLFQGAPAELPCGDGSAAAEGNRALLDSDGGGTIHMADAIYVLNFLYQGGAPPVLGTECVPIPGCEDACAP